MLDKNKVLFDRDEKGEVIPRVVKIVGTEDEIKILPLLRGEFLKISAESKDGETTKDQDKEIILSHVLEPKFTEEDFKFMKTGYCAAIVGTILKHSGLSVDKKKGDGKGEITDF